MMMVLASSLAFVGTHVLLSHPLRASVIKMLGEKGFLLFYSLVAFATLGWMVVAYRSAIVTDMLWTVGEGL